MRTAGHLIATMISGSLALALTACAGDSGGLGVLSPPVVYQASNAVAPNGYSESLLGGPDRYRVRATGHVESSREHLEKIAVARAAEIGRDQRFKYFRVDAVTEDIVCGRKLAATQKTTDMVLKPRRVVDVDITYTNTVPPQGDPAWRNPKESFDALLADAKAPGGVPGAGATGLQDAKAKCGT